MESVANTLRRLGGVAPRRALMREGVSPRRLATALRRGELLRPRQGWYADPSLPADVLAAVRVGGAITAGSAAKGYQLWNLDDRKLHVAVARNSSGLRSPLRPNQRLVDGNVCVHWSLAQRALFAPVTPIVETLVHTLECQSEELAIVMVDSALNQGLVTKDELFEAVAARPKRFREAIDKADGRAQSGTETLVRLRLQKLGLKVTPQFYRPGVGFVDLLVGERLVIECDSRFHDEQAQVDRDYDRDIELIDGDYLVLRLRYRHVLFEWPRIEALILRLAARRALVGRSRAPKS